MTLPPVVRLEFCLASVRRASFAVAARIFLLVAVLGASEASAQIYIGNCDGSGISEYDLTGAPLAVPLVAQPNGDPYSFISGLALAEGDLASVDRFGLGTVAVYSATGGAAVVAPLQVSSTPASVAVIGGTMYVGNVRDVSHIFCWLGRSGVKPDPDHDR